MSIWRGCVIISALLVSCCLYSTQISAQTECFEECDNESLLSIDPRRVLFPGSTLRLVTSNPVTEIGLFNGADDFCDSESFQDAYLFVPIIGSLEDEDLFYNSTLDVWIYELERQEDGKNLTSRIVDLVVGMNAEGQDGSDDSSETTPPCYTSRKMYWNLNEGT